jgi:protein gp37
VALWNPWHGCHKISPGCKHCYVYRLDSRYEKDSSVVAKTGNFDLPMKKNRAGEYKLAGGETIYTCFTSDFFLEDADEWRPEAWRMMRQRPDLDFMIITKRIDRFHVSLPDDWGNGYPNVAICSTVENQDRADYRLPILLKEPIRHKMIICEPLLEPIDLTPHLGPSVEQVVAGGESGNEARLCKFEWVLQIWEQCREKGIPFWFKQTGANFEKDGRVYRVPRKYQHSQARKAGIDLPGKG